MTRGGDGAHGSADGADAWPHAARVEDLARTLDTSREGLADDEAARRLVRDGPNQLDAPPSFSRLALLLAQFRGVVVLLLVAAGIAALATGERLDAAAIGVVLVVNAALGYSTEYRARRALAALRDLEVPHAVVVRGGELRTVEAQTLVAGDVIALRRGQRVPADARVTRESDLHVDEAALTGETFPVSKTSAALPLATPLPERRNMVYKGTLVTSGTGRAVVTATGMRTELGRIGALTTAVGDEQTPLERRLDDLGKRLVWLALAAGAAVTALGLLQGQPLAYGLETGIALAVAAVPEALPAVSTIALAVGVSRMAARHALVRHLPAVEALGSTTVICTDKTRTLTSGVMTLTRAWTTGRAFELDGVTSPDERLRDVLTCGALASQAQASSDQGASADMDPVDAAFLRAAATLDLGREALDRARQPAGLLPFSSEHKFMAAFYGEDRSLVAYVKGAPGVVLARCATDGDGRELTTEGRKALTRINEDLAAQGLRVLALARGVVAAPDEPSTRGLTFIGFAGLSDPPAPGVAATIARLRGAGLRLVMVTGDQRATAEAVSTTLGLGAPGDPVVGPAELAGFSEDDLQREARRAVAFARVTPEQKVAIVRALQADGQIVAMIGDGINDAAALKQADVGVAMGLRGTDVAREAAAIVLEDDRLDTIATAVEHGRVIFDNIRKFVFYLFSCNVGEVLTLLGAGLVGLPSPLTPLQILWMNLLTDTLPALSLAVEPGETDVMRRPPRDPHEAILSRAFLSRIFFYGALIAGSTLAAFAWFLHAGPSRAGSAAFTTLAMAQVFHLGTARHTGTLTLRRIFANPAAIGAVAITLLLQLAALYVAPLASVLALEPLHPADWLVVVPAAALTALSGYAARVWRARSPSAPAR